MEQHTHTKEHTTYRRVELYKGGLGPVDVVIEVGAVQDNHLGARGTDHRQGAHHGKSSHGNCARYETVRAPITHTTRHHPRTREGQNGRVLRPPYTHSLSHIHPRHTATLYTGATYLEYAQRHD